MPTRLLVLIPDREGKPEKGDRGPALPRSEGMGHRLSKEVLILPGLRDRFAPPKPFHRTVVPPMLDDRPQGTVDAAGRIRGGQAGRG